MESDLFNVFLNANTALLCLGVYLITFAVRQVIEVTWKAALANKYYTELFLQLGPVGNGAILGVFAKKFPWPALVSDSLSARMMYGAVCGMACGWVYARFRSWFKTATEIPTAIDNPADPRPPIASAPDNPADPRRTPPPPAL